jgi:DNA (cytosine-5)-methyltransferase 1
MKTYSVISLFSGAMGLDIGLEQTGRFRVKAAVEKERSFCETIRANRDAGRLDPALALFEGDISQIDPAEVMAAAGLKPGQLDVLVGGPPCQSFSTAGRRGTIQDARGTLLWEYLRFVGYMRPRFFLMENVRGLLSAGLRHRPIAERPEKGGAPLAIDELPGSVVRLFADDLQKIAGGYHMDCFEVNAVNYGAPQLRERALFIGNRFNTQLDFPNPTHGKPRGEEIEPADLFGPRENVLPWKTLGEAISNIDANGDVLMDFSPRKKSFLELVPPGSNWRSLPVSVQKESMGRAWLAKGGRSGWWRRLSFDLPCPTLVTMPNHASTSLCHPTEARALSLKEYAAVQEFPKDWEFRGTTSQQYAQVGNAVPVRLGRVAGEVISKALDGIEARRMRPFPTPPSHYRVIYVQSHVRTRQWFKAGETFVWEEGAANQEVRYAAPVVSRRAKRMAAE